MSFFRLTYRLRGGMTFPLAGAKTRQEFNETTTYFGDFVQAGTRRLVLGSPRHYKFSIKLVDLEGNVVSESDYGVHEQKLDRYELAELIKQMSREQINEVDRDIIDIYKSTITVELLQEKE